ncbi:hypothetical protein F5J12DRAFT_836728 [Pisolithus orientalis]|uniref:uncharacterized protein n=1 Tax=Pisolithus orientalis TaxID=936130 RepID=UPI002224F958|nr:uncharacterized protein F5J12DRAFT_836728 [Pisolithus orientalis]KAI6004420.1 hypothetical protein F5J12DRAFT_836728 [Pisolithus orientalis]
MKQKQIHRTATFAWSPNSCLPLISTGTVSGALDESFSNESQLEIWKPDFMDKDEYALGADLHSQPAGVVKDTSRFNRIVWSQAHKDRTSGVIAAGMENAELVLWDPAKIVESSDASTALILRNTKHTGPVRGLDFNPKQTNLLCSGAVNGEIYIWDLNDPSKPYSPTPGSRSKKVDEITCVTWNQHVQSILAGASSTGYTVVWDLRQNRELVALAYGGGTGTLGGAVGSAMAVGGRRGMSAIAWHPDVATRLVTASEDDISPVVMVWDLRNARAPEKILTGHEKGVLSLSWCKQDADLLLSCGKDNRVLCWNPQTSEVIGELPSEDNWAFHVEWCPRNPDLLAAAFFSGTIGIHSIQSTDGPATIPPTPKASGASLFDDLAFMHSNAGLPSLSLKQPPKWLRRPVSASFGFGGQLASVCNLPDAQGGTQSSTPHVRVVCTEKVVVERVKNLRKAAGDGDLENFAQEVQADVQQHGDARAAETWKALLSLFRANSRDELVTLLGYSKEEVKARVAEAVAHLKEMQQQQPQTEQSEEGSLEQRVHEPVVSFAEPEHDIDGEQETEEKTSSEVSTSDLLPPDGESTTTAPSLFGDDPVGTFHNDAGADFFSTMAAAPQDDSQDAPLAVPHTNYGVDSSVAATVGSGPSSVASASESLTLRGNTFRIYPAEESETDQLVTKALVLGDFESAVELCLSTERYADALLLAIKGGQDLLQRTQNAYFARQTTEHPYLRLFQSIVTNDLADVVQNADLTEWAEIFVVLCTFASNDEFGGLAEQLGARLEFQAGVLRGQAEDDDNAANSLELRNTATLTYLAAGRLERLLNIWVEEMAEEEARRIHEKDALTDSRYAAHAHALQTFIEKVTVFRGAVNYNDTDISTSTSDEQAAKAYKLASLYDRYFEYAEMLAAQGLVKEAVEYLRLIPQGYTGSALDFAAVRERLLIASGETAAPRPISTATQRVPAVPIHAPVNARVQTPVQGGKYLPPQPAYQPVQPTHQPELYKGPYVPAHTLSRPALLSQPAVPPHTRPPVAAGPPPPRSQNGGGWNDAPMVKPAERRTPNSSSTSKLAAIVSPFPNATQSPPTPGSPFSGHNTALPPPPRPASVQNRPPPPPQARAPPPPQARQPPGPPPARMTSPAHSHQPSTATGTASPFRSPPTVSAPLGQPSGPYARATPPPGPGPRGAIPPPPGPYARVTPSPAHAVPPSGGPQAGPYAPPPSSQTAPGGPPQPGPYAPPPPGRAAPSGPYAPPGQVSMGSGHTSYAPPMAQAPAMRGPPPTQQPLVGMPPPSVQGPPSGGPSTAPPPARAALSPPAPTQPKYPQGDRSHIPESSMQIYAILSEQLQRVKQTIPSHQRRMADDLERRINSLFDALNCDTLSKSVIDQLNELTKAMEAHDRDAALVIHVDLLTRGSQTDDIGLWMSSIKQLIMRL